MQEYLLPEIILQTLAKHNIIEDSIFHYKFTMDILPRNSEYVKCGKIKIYVVS